MYDVKPGKKSPVQVAIEHTYRQLKGEEDEMQPDGSLAKGMSLVEMQQAVETLSGAAPLPAMRPR